MSYFTLPVSFWGYAIQTSYYLLNNISLKSVAKTPHELWTSIKIILNHICKWGCHSYVLDKELNKLDSHSKVCMFVGYPRGTIEGYFYNPKDNKVLIFTNATFLEESYIQDIKSQSKVMLEEMSNSIVALTVPEVENISINKERPIEQQTLRSLVVVGGFFDN